MVKLLPLNGFAFGILLLNTLLSDQTLSATTFFSTYHLLDDNNYEVNGDSLENLCLRHSYYWW